MANWQFVLTLLTIVIAIFGASWLNIHQIDKRLEEMGRRFDAQIEAVKGEIRRLDGLITIVQDDIKEIKADLKQVFKSVLLK